MMFRKDTDSESSGSGNNAGEEWTLERHNDPNSHSYGGHTAHGNSAATVTSPTESSGRIRRYICFAMTGCVMIVCTVSLLFVYGVLDNSHVPQGFFDSDPFGGRVKAGNPEDAHAWANGGSGLRLTVLNAVDDSWQAFFDVGVADWENGSPNALTLSTRKVVPEMQCDPQTGVLKVCNGSYGETGWKGLNAVLLDPTSRDIRASSAMMNDHYLAPDNLIERTYTMCHELGHGFGLPHWDENFWNRDLGNCMDYTRNPEANLNPDIGNFNRLEGLYGDHNRRRRRNLRTSAEPIASKNNEDGDDAQYQSFMEEFRAWTASHRRGSIVPEWRKLGEENGESDHGDVFERRLNDEMTLQIHVL